MVRKHYRVLMRVEGDLDKDSDNKGKKLNGFRNLFLEDNLILLVD